jgi:ATP-dependent helicase/nuclease subunit B
LESYAACSFRFFAENLLELKALDDLTLAGDPGRRGSLLHQVLAAIHAQLLEQPADSPTDEAWQAELAARFARALEAHIAATPLGGVEESLREIERRQIDAWADRYARQEAEYRQRWRHLDEPPRPAFFEVRFGPGESASAGGAAGASAGGSAGGASNPLPFELDLGEEKIRIVGQIDRIDVGRVGGVTVLNVIDYKSGREVRLKDEHFQAGRQLQLPLYALAAEEHLFHDQGARALAAGYWSIQGQGFEKGHMTLRSVESGSLGEPALPVRSQVRETVRQLVAGIRAGQFPVYNVDPKCTHWCEFSTICRVAHIRSLEKQWPPAEEPAS